jgi:hypothetical protein
MAPNPETLTKQIEHDAKLAVSATGAQIEITRHKLFEDMVALQIDPQLAKVVNERLHKDAQADPSLPRVGAIVEKDGTVDALLFGPSVKQANKDPDNTAIIEEPLNKKGDVQTHLPGNPLGKQFLEKFYPNLIERPRSPNDVA